MPIYTAIAQLTSFTLGWHPQLVVSNVGIDPTTVAGLLKTVSKGKASGTALIEGAITDGYLPSSADTSNPWIQLFTKIQAQYDPSAPFDFNTEYGMANAYMLVQALEAAGKNLTRQDLVNAVDKSAHRGRARAGPAPLLEDRSRRLGRRQMGQSRAARSSCSGQPLTTRSDGEQSDRAVHRRPDDAPGKRDSVVVGTRRPPGLSPACGTGAARAAATR